MTWTIDITDRPTHPRPAAPAPRTGSTVIPGGEVTQAALTLHEIGEAQTLVELTDAVCAAVQAGNPLDSVARRACVPVETVVTWIRTRRTAELMTASHGYMKY